MMLLFNLNIMFMNAHVVVSAHSAGTQYLHLSIRAGNTL